MQPLNLLWQHYALLALAVSSLYIFYQIIKLLWPWSDNTALTEYTKRLSANQYTGEYDDNNLYHGQGRLVGENGDTYEGTFSHGQMHGTGKYTYNTLNKNVEVYYSGQFENGQFNGHGTETYTDSSMYTGSYENGLRHGYGVMVYGTRDVDKNTKHVLSYTGDWERGAKQGTGVLQFNDLSTFAGRFVDGKRDGNGVYTDANGVSKKVVYKQGKLQVKRKSVIAPANNKTEDSQPANETVDAVTPPATDSVNDDNVTDEHTTTQSTDSVEGLHDSSLTDGTEHNLADTAPQQTNQQRDLLNVARFASPIHKDQLHKRHVSESKAQTAELIG